MTHTWEGNEAFRMKFYDSRTSKKIGCTCSAEDDAWNVQVISHRFREVHEFIIDDAGDLLLWFLFHYLSS